MATKKTSRQKATKPAPKPAPKVSAPKPAPKMAPEVREAAEKILNSVNKKLGPPSAPKPAPAEKPHPKCSMCKTVREWDRATGNFSDVKLNKEGLCVRCEKLPKTVTIKCAVCGEDLTLNRDEYDALVAEHGKDAPFGHDDCADSQE
jgi:hypothetical protein